MHLTPELLERLEREYGRPELGRAEAVFSDSEFDLLRYCARKQRVHDVTLFIRGVDGRFAVIRKPSYPPEIFRPPSGGVEQEESFEEGAAREALEEAGLAIRLERYLLRVNARFSCAGEIAPWSTHVFLASTPETNLAPRDLREIAEARWAAVEEMVGEYRPRMLALGSEGFRYRVDLQDSALRLMGLADPPPPPSGRLILPGDKVPGGPPPGS